MTPPRSDETTDGVPIRTIDGPPIRRIDGPTESRPSRRRFLRAGAALPALALIGTGRVPGQGGRTENAGTLRALAEVVLPTGALQDGSLDRVVRQFGTWSEGIEPNAELDHPYLWTDEIAYGPADPRPAWAEQLAALETESRARQELSFAQLANDDRLAVLRGQLPDDAPERLPDPLRAPHVALALLSWFYATSEANDLCYQRRIGRHQCRGLPSAPEVPAPLTGDPWSDE